MCANPRRLTAVHVMLVFAVVVVCTRAVRSGDFVPGGPCTRGRVTLSATTVVTDWGTNLRGPCWCMDCHGGIFKIEEFTTMRMCGMNAIHIYGENNDANPVGFEADNIDTLVEWCRRESLYVVLTFGNSAVPNYNKLYDFWRFYAPRYANQTHVIFEIKNEPGEVVQMTKQASQIIRESAPQTHIMCFSPSNVKGGPSGILNAIQAVGDAVDWSNASVAFHSYGSSGAFLEGVIKAINDAGYGMTCTEFPTGSGVVPTFEKMDISYFHFYACWPPSRTPGTICGLARSLGVSWQPDFGDWPQPHVEHPELVQVRMQPWRAAESRDGVLVGRMMTCSLSGKNVLAIYDVTGKLLWRNSADGGAANGQPMHIPLPLGSQVLLVKYPKR